jgi:hypothetical protein
MVITHVGKNAQVVETDGLGVWTQVGSTIYYTVEAVLSDLKGNLTGFFKVSGFYHLTSVGDSYEGNSYYQVLNPSHENGGLPQGWVCNAGVRITVESTPTDPPPPEHCVPPAQP